MKKITLIVSVSILGLISCEDSQTGSQDLNKQVDRICNCMDNKTKEREKEESILPLESFLEVDYASCALDIILEEGADPTSKEFANNVGEKCPNLKEVAMNYTKK